MQSDPEFSRPMSLRRLINDANVTLEAKPEECAALALRMNLPAIASLSCKYRITEQGAGALLAEGALTTRLTQICVLTLDKFEDVIAERFAIRFVPASRFKEQESYDPDGIDDVPFDSDTIDLGETTAEQLALVLDPYPHRPNAKLPAQYMSDGEDDDLEADEPEEPKRQPFAALAKLRRSDN